MSDAGTRLVGRTTEIAKSAEVAAGKSSEVAVLIEGAPWHYDLHAWLWADNPAGTFAPFNPTLSCP